MSDAVKLVGRRVLCRGWRWTASTKHVESIGPVKNWIVWSVPMITEEGADVSGNKQPTSSYSTLALGAWLPPFHHKAWLRSLPRIITTRMRPEKIGEMGLYGGDYQGRIIRLFSSEDTTDLGEPIPAWIETGWLHLGSSEWVKLIRRLQIYGQTASGNTITVKIWVDGNA